MSFNRMKRKGSHSRNPDGAAATSTSTSTSTAHQPRGPGDGEASSKRPRLAKHWELETPSYDVTRDMSDELLLRIFSYVDERTLLAAAPVSRQFYRVASDPQLWRSHYYRRFILPRANRIPGLEPESKAPSAAAGPSGGGGGGGSSLPSSSSSSSSSSLGRGRGRAQGELRGPAGALSADDRGSSARLMAPTPADAAVEPAKEPFRPADPAGKSKQQPEDHVDWKQQYRLRHNWARGLCEVRRVQVSPVDFALTPILQRRTLVKVAHGLAVTVDLQAGLRAWDLRSHLSIAQTSTETPDGIRLVPTALALDGQRLAAGALDIMLGFNDGTFGIWRLLLPEGRLVVLYRQDKSYVGRLTSVAYSYPYALTAAELGFISLYTFEAPAQEPEPPASAGGASAAPPFPSPPLSASSSPSPPSSPSPAAGEARGRRGGDHDRGHDEGAYLDEDDEVSALLEGEEFDRSAYLSHPFVLSSLKSDYSRRPLVLSLRKLATSAVASIAYSFDTVGGWAIGIQNFDIRPSGGSKPDVVTSRVAYTLPADPGGLVASTSYRPRCPTCSSFPDLDMDDDETGPAKLCYSHPYLLATMQDNTLVLFVVTATEKSFSISNAMRLYGHTSGIADADVTPEGRAVSVSERGDEIRVWDLEGRQDGVSVEVKPRPSRDPEDDDDDDDDASLHAEHWRNWVGTDDQRVTVLRETSDGRESLVTYDFT
ncbi:f-box domain-containing [Trichoderma cornu-damae]|uniref:F-box domain-containing n=1 Tax=Trichoderma cornu-damae TaxID=654480 RepID=A0A9P8QPA9_9HYPO|nr:f-box domain-containing [Trichoderma cornu-damae]